MLTHRTGRSDSSPDTEHDRHDDGFVSGVL
jgi:hypothetical protein